MSCDGKITVNIYNSRIEGPVALVRLDISMYVYVLQYDVCLPDTALLAPKLPDCLYKPGTQNPTTVSS